MTVVSLIHLLSLTNPPITRSCLINTLCMQDQADASWPNLKTGFLFHGRVIGCLTKQWIRVSVDVLINHGTRDWKVHWWMLGELEATISYNITNNRCVPLGTSFIGLKIENQYLVIAPIYIVGMGVSFWEILSIKGRNHTWNFSSTQLHNMDELLQKKEFFYNNFSFKILGRWIKMKNCSSSKIRSNPFWIIQNYSTINVVYQQNKNS